MDDPFTYRSILKKDFLIQISFKRHNPESASKITADPRSTVFSKSANPGDLPHKSTIRALFKAKSVDPRNREIKAKKFNLSNGTAAKDLCETGGVVYQLSY